MIKTTVAKFMTAVWAASIWALPAVAWGNEPAVGTVAEETLSGNGACAGYVLSHGAIVPESEDVFMGVKKARRDVDYMVDYTSGMLFFAQPVKETDTIRVAYRFQDSANKTGLISFSPTRGLRVAPMYYRRASGQSLTGGAPDVLTYGLNASAELGADSTVNGLMFFSKPEMTGKAIASRMAIGAGPVDMSKGKLVLQNADLGIGSVRLKLGYQQVDNNFAGFPTLRDSKAASSNVLNQLEREKGIKRMNLAGELPTRGQDGLGFSIFSIDDGQGDIVSQAFNFSGASLKARYQHREVGAGFKRFADLREEDRGQLAAEAGVDRTSYGIEFRSGSNSKGEPAWSGISFTRLQDCGGSLEHRSADLDLGKLRIQADTRTVSPHFGRMAALSDSERSRIALTVRRQFDAKAGIEQVTAEDKQAVANESGISRQSYLVAFDGAGMDTWLSLSNISTYKGALSRGAVTLEGRGFGLTFSHQTIAPAFSRISSLQPVERAHYGNEYGMKRSGFGGEFAIGKASAELGYGHVTDHQGAGVERRRFEFKQPGLIIRANFQEIDRNFSRIGDLSDEDRSKLVKERGFSRRDYYLNVQASRDVNVDAYIYDSTNTFEGQTRSQNRYKIAYAPTKGPKLTAFADSYSYIAETGNLSSYSRRKIDFDNSVRVFGGLLIKGLSDVNTIWEEDSNPLTTTITQTHVESDQRAATAFTVDTLDTDFGDGRYEQTMSLGAKTRATRDLSLVASFSNTVREENRGSTGGMFGVDWAVKKDLKMTVGMSANNGGDKGEERTVQFSLNGPIARRFLLFEDVRIASGMHSSELRGRRTVCDNAIKIQAGSIGGVLVFDNSDKLNAKSGVYYTSRILKYETNTDSRTPYRLKLFRQNLITPQGISATKRNYALSYVLPAGSKLTFASYFGKDEQNGAVVPVGGSSMKYTLKIGRVDVLADFASDRNDLTGRDARTAGVGVSGVLSTKAVYEVYLGVASLAEEGGSDRTNVFRIKFDHKIDSDHFVVLSAEKKSGVDKTTINPYEGPTVGRIEFRTTFH